MKIKTCIILLFFWSCIDCIAQDNKLKSVKIAIEDFDTETDIAISCEAFNSTFRDTKKRIFQNNQDLSEFKVLTKGFKPVKSKSIDVRGEIFFSEGATVHKYCFDKFAYFYDGSKLYYNKKLLIFLLNKMYNKHPHYLDTLRQAHE